MNFSYFSRNKLKLIKFSSLFATDRLNAKIIKKIKNYTKDMIIKELLELFNRFYKKFIKLNFYRCMKARCNETKLITKCERFYCVY